MTSMGRRPALLLQSLTYTRSNIEGYRYSPEIHSSESGAKTPTHTATTPPIDILSIAPHARCVSRGNPHAIIERGYVDCRDNLGDRNRYDVESEWSQLVTRVVGTRSLYYVISGGLNRIRGREDRLDGDSTQFSCLHLTNSSVLLELRSFLSPVAVVYSSLLELFWCLSPHVDQDPIIVKTVTFLHKCPRCSHLVDDKLLPKITNLFRTSIF